MEKLNVHPKTGISTAGFTLVEVLTVMVVIGILAAIAVPNFLSWLPGMRLKAASRDVFSKMQEARMLAIKGNRNYAIVFDIPNNQYFVRDDSGPDHLPNTGDGGENDSTYSANETLETVVLTTYGSGVTYGSGPATVDVSENPGPATLVSYLIPTVPATTAVFDPRGFGNAGYVYLSNQNNDDSFAIGSLSSGSIRLLRWTGGVVGDKWQ